MTKTRAPLHKKSATQNTAGMESIPVTSVSEIPSDVHNVKLEYAANTAEVTGARVEPSANVFSQTPINTSLGGLLLCK